jgi:N-acylneuraminate cytidylyltransferase
MSNLCIIPARGGSKRIPRKNIKDFLGKPIIAYSIEAAINSGLFDEVMVSTDDEEIAKVAKKYGAAVPFLRNSETSDDYATLSDVIEEVVLEYASNSNKFDFVCCILATAPLLKIKFIKESYTKLLENSYIDSIRPIVKYSYPIRRSFKMLRNGRVEFIFPDYLNARSQDLEDAFHDAGQFYWMRSKLMLKGSNRYGYEISELYVQDIDNDVDWKLCELKYALINDVHQTKPIRE